MKSRYLFFCLLIGRFLIASPFIWVPNEPNNKVLVIDKATNTIFQTIPQTVGSFENPLSIASTPATNQFTYVFNQLNNTVSIINTTTYQLETLIPLIPLGSSTTKGQIAVSPNGEFVYVTNGEQHVVSVISTSTQSLVTIISGSGILEPTGIVFSPDSMFAYVTDSAANQLFRINTFSYAVTPQLKVFNQR